MPPADPIPNVGNLRCTFECDASSSKWEVIDATIVEELNEPYHVSLSLRTDDLEADPTEMLGESCTLVVERDELSAQYPAVIHEVEDTAGGRRFMDIRVEASAALFMLSQTRQTRIFQEQTVPEILDQVLTEGLNPYQRKVNTDLTRDYPKCEYRVQYDETDLAFCQRLMEEEGIVFWFERGDEEEAIFLTDDPTASFEIESAEGNAEVHFSTLSDMAEHVTSFNRSSVMRPTKLSTRHYDWTKPKPLIEETQEGEESDDFVDGSAVGPLRERYQHDLVPPTHYDYDEDDGYKKDDAKEQAEMRRQLDMRDKLVMQGRSSVLNFGAGGSFELLEHTLEGGYVLTRVHHHFSVDGADFSYANSFACLPAGTPFRPDRRTPKPKISSIETATVVGPKDQEIHTDKHGRIKVQFHWDREGQNDEHSSCFIRVTQPWAGAGWGFVFLPRIGMEVTVAFIHGDPDRPIVTGTVYNGENLTPYEMPNEMTKSTIRTQSSPGGDGYNELSFEDKAGEEEIFLQAQKNLRETIKNNQSTSVGADQSLSVGANRSVTVDKNQTIHIKGSQNITIDGGEAGDDVTGGKMSITGDYKLDTSNEITMEAPAFITLDCGGSKIEMSPDYIILTVGGSSFRVDAQSISGLAGEGSMLTVDKDVLAQSSGGSGVLLTEGVTASSSQGASVELTQDAKMTAPVNAEVMGGANADLTAGANASVTGAITKVTGSGVAELTGGGQAKVTGGMVSVTGGMVSIN